MGKKKSSKAKLAKILPMDMSKTTASTERKVFVNRPLLFPIHTVAKGLDVLTQTQSPGVVGSQFTTRTLSFSARSLSQSSQNWIQNYDAYRFRKIDVFANLVFLTKGSNDVTQDINVVHYCYEDIDTSEDVVTSWIRVQDRSNINRVVLTAQRPSAKVASFVPQPTYPASSGSNPADLIGKEMDWVDAVDLAFQYAGLRCFSCCLLQQQPGQNEYTYSISYEVRVSVDARCMI